VTLRAVAEDWIKARSALKQQPKMLEGDSAIPKSGYLKMSGRQSPPGLTRLLVSSTRS